MTLDLFRHGKLTLNGTYCEAQLLLGAPLTCAADSERVLRGSLRAGTPPPQ